MAYIPISERAAQEFGRTISRLIELRGVSQTELARRVGVSKQLISQIASGRIPSPDVVRKLARALDVPYLELWMQAYHELIPEGYDLVPVEPEAREALTMPRYLAEHPAFARLWEVYRRLPEDQAEQALQFLECLFGART